MQASSRAAVCDYKPADLASVADQLERLRVDSAAPPAGRIDLDRLGAFGHSFGGNATLEWCRNDRRCQAAANLDGALWTEVGRVGLDRPVLQVLAEHPEFALSGADAITARMATDTAAYDAEKAITFGGWRRVHQQGRPGYTVQVKGATHLSFMDVPLLTAISASTANPLGMTGLPSSSTQPAGQPAPTVHGRRSRRVHVSRYPARLEPSRRG